MALQATTRLAVLPRRLPTSIHQQTRPFFSLPGASSSSSLTTQHLTASRTLPYAISPLYALIADVDSYSSFVPYCSHSRVTHWSQPDEATSKRWPTQGDLHVGWGGFNETFTSKLTCVPNVSVEATSGSAEAAASAVFRSLVTRWSVRPARDHTEEKPSTDVHLAIKYEFANPLYAAVSAAVSDKVAGMMIEAFEKRAREKLNGKKSI